MSCSCNQCIFDHLSTPNMYLCHENWTHILWKKCRPMLTNNPNLHSFLLITESGSLSYWTQHANIYKWGKFHALIIFWKLLQLSSWTRRLCIDMKFRICKYQINTNISILVNFRGNILYINKQVCWWYCISLHLLNISWPAKGFQYRIN